MSDTRTPQPSASDERASEAKRRGAFVRRRVHSLLGAFPLGAFLVAHLWMNATALRGEAAYTSAVRAERSVPGLGPVSVLLLLGPLAFHALFGARRALTARPNTLAYPTAANARYGLQRLTGLVALAFLVAHLLEYRGATMWGSLGTEAFYPTLARRLSSTNHGLPWVALGYLVGTAACVFHGANGMATFFSTWGLVRSARGRRYVEVMAALGGTVLVVVGAVTVLYFATGADMTGAALEACRLYEKVPSVLEKP